MDTPLSILLKEKAQKKIFYASPTDTIHDCVLKLSETKVGALLVLEWNELCGIITERDILWKVVSLGLDTKKTRVAEIMTKKLTTVTPTTTVREAMRLVTEHRFRHLPVLEHGRVIGIISIGDLTRWAMLLQEEQILSLTSYIYR